MAGFDEIAKRPLRGAPHSRRGYRPRGERSRQAGPASTAIGVGHFEHVAQSGNGRLFDLPNTLRGHLHIRGGITESMQEKKGIYRKYSSPVEIFGPIDSGFAYLKRKWMAL
ncbi:hypothetical protein ACWGS9_19545 [Bradyrhizobium sp. Arg314]